MDSQQPRHAMRSGVALNRTKLRGYAGVPRAARCGRVYAGTQGCIYAGRRQLWATSLLITLAAEGLAQSSEQDPIREGQTQLEEMRSQTVTMQNRIATLEADKGTAEVRSQPDETKSAGELTGTNRITRDPAPGR